ncbi:MAG: DUF4920 domain-containing protein [Bryobacteraceae bacterium]
MKIVPVLLLAAGLCSAAALNLGSPLTLKQAEPVDKILSAAASHVGKTVQVKGKITEVCQMAGCWMSLADVATGKLLRIKVDDGDLVFPKDSIGKLAVAEGKLVKIELTREQAIGQAKHEAEEQGRKFNAASVKSGLTIYQIQGTGASILE